VFYLCPVHRNEPRNRASIENARKLGNQGVRGRVRDVHSESPVMATTRCGNYGSNTTLHVSPAETTMSMAICYGRTNHGPPKIFGGIVPTRVLYSPQKFGVDPRYQRYLSNVIY
jgi:hypothetical protein